MKCDLSGDGVDGLFVGCDKHVSDYQLLTDVLEIELVKRPSFLWNLMPAYRNSFATNKV